MSGLPAAREPADLRLTVSRRGALRWAAGHPWIFRSDVATGLEPEHGALVGVQDPRGRVLGTACYSAHSQIALRCLARGPQPVSLKSLLPARLASALALRRQLFPESTMYRLVHGEADGLPGLVVDRYGDWLSVQFLTATMDRARGLVLDALQAQVAPRGIINRSDVAVRRLEGLVPEKGVLQGQWPGHLLIREGGIELEVDLLEGQKTGAFLDQRENHLLAGQYARGRALDCFSYAGGFALQMARQASEVTALDISADACAGIEANARRNGLDNLEVHCGNAFDFLRAAQADGAAWDTIVLDPPAFAKQRSAQRAGLRGYKEINLRALRLLRPGGILVTASCSYHVDETLFMQVVAEAAADAGRSVQLLERRGAGRDHPSLPAMPEGRYLKLLVLRVTA
ncbi:MAG: class I SAM-dependent rRNA methyltransferase [Chromatiales bacterium]|nr:class I SAM-dependent rRNA methyltransferase [Chromatiales bacterium]